MSYSKDTQSRKWTLVINNPEEHGFTAERIIELLHLFSPDYFCMAEEIASSGTHHIHIFLYSHSPIRFGTVKNRFPTAHIEPVRGSCRENRDYIRKEGKWAETAKAETRVEGTFVEFGELPTEAQEKAPKMAQVLQDVEDGKSTKEIIKDNILLGGSTGSGKSVLLKLLLMQAIQKGSQVCISDFKGGVDFPPIWHEKCRMCVDEESTLELLNDLTEELKRRKKLLAAAGQSNIDRYNAATGEQLSRYIFACDEIAEVLDKTGLTKEQKEIVSKIESRLSMIARQGRAFGIHLILATQRPDANILSGQIKNNVNCRICGRADTVLSQIILDNTSAAEQIPKDARGRFLLHDGTVFQAYWFDDEGGW